MKGDPIREIGLKPAWILGFEVIQYGCQPLKGDHLRRSLLKGDPIRELLAVVGWPDSINRLPFSRIRSPIACNAKQVIITPSPVKSDMMPHHLFSWWRGDDQRKKSIYSRS